MKDIEIIVVNDGSPDNAGKICDEIAAIDSRIRMFHQENQGGCVAMENGVKYSTGEYIMFLDGDDWLNFETCEIAYAAAIKEQAEIVFWTYYKEFPNRQEAASTIFKADKIFVNDDLAWLKRRFVGLLGEELRYPTTTDAFSSGWGKLYKRDLLEKEPEAIIDKNGQHNFDTLINIRLFHQATKVVYLHRFFNHYRQDNPSSTTKSHQLSLFKKYRTLFDNISTFMQEKGLSGDYKIALQNRIALSVINNALSLANHYNNNSEKIKIRHLQNILETKTYQIALDDLNMKFLGLHWKLFFQLCRWRQAYFVYFLAKIMIKLR